MSQPTHATTAAAGSARMEDEAPVAEQKQQSVPATSTASADYGSSPSAAEPTLTAATTDDARAARLARRSQLRDETERNDAVQERRRMEALATKAAARESRLAAALAAQTALWRSFGPAQKLFADGVASCLGFLSLADFNSAAQTCKGWRSAAHTVKYLGPADFTAALSVLPSLLSSPFRHLIQSFVGPRSPFPNELDWLGINDHIPCSCGPAPLNCFRALSNLTSLQIGLDLAQFNGSETLQFPPLLTMARLKLGCDWSNVPDDRSPDAASILPGLAACSSLTLLDLDLQLMDEFPIALNALAAISSLRHLSIDGYELHLKPATLQAIKTLSQLERLTLKHTCDKRFNDENDSTRPEWLTSLLTAPHQLQRLQSLDAPGCWLWDNQFCTQLLPSLPSLTELKPPFACMSALPILAAFPSLRILHLWFDGEMDKEQHQDNGDLAAAYDEDGCARLSVLVPHLAHCSLTELELDRVACDDEGLTALCKSQPMLRVLLLKNAVLTTVRPLRTLPHLTHVSVRLAEHSDGVPGLFDQISAYKSLRQLELSSIERTLSEDQQRQLTPPSAVLPLLTKLTHTVRQSMRASQGRIRQLMNSYTS